MNQPHALVVEGDLEEGIEVARAWAREELGMTLEKNPDFSILRFGLLSVDDARRVGEVVMQAPFTGEHKVLIIAASRASHEAQNALLKVFEEQPKGAFIFLVVPSIGGLLPTLLSRVQVLRTEAKAAPVISESAEAFIRADKEKRTALIKKLTSGKDEEVRREHRDEAISIVNGVEAVAYKKFQKERGGAAAALLSDIATLRGHLHDRSAPVKMILEHLSLVLPKNLL